MKKIIQLSVVPESDALHGHVLALTEDGQIYRATIEEENLLIWFPITSREAMPGDYKPSTKG